MTDHPYGWLSLLPPLIAIVLAIVTRRVVLSLAVGIFAGALVMARGRGNPSGNSGHGTVQHLGNSSVAYADRTRPSACVFVHVIDGFADRRHHTMWRNARVGAFGLAPGQHAPTRAID